MEHQTKGWFLSYSCSWFVVLKRSRALMVHSACYGVEWGTVFTWTFSNLSLNRTLLHYVWFFFSCSLNFNHMYKFEFMLIFVIQNFACSFFLYITISLYIVLQLLLHVFLMAPADFLPSFLLPLAFFYTLIYISISSHRAPLVWGEEKWSFSTLSVVPSNWYSEPSIEQIFPSI